MENFDPQDEMGEQQKEAYQAGIARYNESTDGTGKINDERYTECRKAWKKFLCGEYTADELARSIEKYDYKTITLKEVKLTQELFDVGDIDEQDI